MNISFVVSCRGRLEMRPGFISNIRKYYPDSEILFCNQKDALLFRKGQLANLGFKLVKHDIIAFINLDYRFMEYVDLIFELDKHKVPVIPFSDGRSVIENPLGIFKIVVRSNPDSVGGCVVLTKEQFKESGGNTNLIFGWGPDDIVFAQRIGKFKKLPYTMGHIQHSKNQAYRAMKNYNRRMCFCPPPKPELDAYYHTIADRVGSKVLSENIIQYDFINIRVSDDFGYMDKYNQQIVREKKVLGL